jgi:hypothetical protein
VSCIALCVFGRVLPTNVLSRELGLESRIYVAAVRDLLENWGKIRGWLQGNDHPEDPERPLDNREEGIY